MSIVTNTLTRYDYTKSVREDLSDVIYNISPVDVPFQSNIGRDKASQTYTEWQTDSLAAAVSTNAQLEGDDVASTSGALSATNRVGNYTQISRKIVMTSSTLEASDKAGMRSAKAYNLAKAANELKRDIETTLTGVQTATVGNNTVARKTAGLGSWVITNWIGGTGTAAAAPAMSSGSDGYPATAAVAGTATAITETRLKSALQKVWTQGGSPDMAMCGPVNKVLISAFTGIATRFRDVPAGKQAQIIGAADVYVSDFGTVSIVPNRFQPESVVYVVDKSMAAVSYLRPFQSVPLAKTGDAEKSMLIVEYALKVKNEKAFSQICDCTTS